MRKWCRFAGMGKPIDPHWNSRGLRKLFGLTPRPKLKSSSVADFGLDCQHRPPQFGFACQQINFNLLFISILKLLIFEAINTDKITFLVTKFTSWHCKSFSLKLKNSARQRHCCKISKTNIKTLISLLLGAFKFIWFKSLLKSSDLNQIEIRAQNLCVQ